ncbi:hypothetical protein Tco_0599925 [Tanacetum coccineum]
MESSNSNSKERELQLTQRLAKQRHSICMTCIIRSFFGEEHQTFKLKMYHNLDQLRLQLERENLHGVNAKTCLQALRTQFKEFLASKGVNATDLLNQGWQQDFEYFTRCEPSAYRREWISSYEILHEHQIKSSVKMQSQDIQINPVQAMDDSLIVSKSSLIESENHNAFSKSEIETQMQRQEEKVNMREAVDAGLVVTESSGTKPDKQDTSSSLGNYTTQAVDADIGPVNDEEPFAEVQLTALHNILANEQQHTEQSEPSYDTHLLETIDSNTTPTSTNMCHRGGEIDQDALLKTELLKTKDMVDKEIYNELSKRFLQLEKHCISLEIQIQQKEESFQSNKPFQSPKIRNNNPVEPKNHTHKPGRQNGIGQRFSLNKSSAVHEKPHTPRSYLRWKPTGRIFKTVSLRWIPTGKVFIDSTTKVDSEPPNGSNDDITTQYDAIKLFMLVQRSLLHDNIVPKPDLALELGKSISLTKAEEEAVAREVHATHARIVSGPDPEPMQEDQTGSNSGKLHVSLAGPNPEHMDDEFLATAYPKVHENLKLITDERVIEENPESHSGSMSSMKNLDDTYNFGDQFLYDKPTEDDQEKSKVIEESDSTIPDPSHQTVTSTPPVIAPFTDVSSTKPSSLVTPPPINTEATTITTSLPEITPFIALQLRVARLEQEMSEVKKTDHSADVLASIKSQVPTVVDEYLGTKLDDSLLKILERHTADLIEKYSVLPGPDPSLLRTVTDWKGKPSLRSTERSLLHDNIVPKPDLALELGKSISLTEAEEEAVAREVHATHARIVSESEPEPTQRRQSEPTDIMKALKESKKMNKRQPGTRGSNEGTGNILGVPDESTVVSRASSEGTGSKLGVPDEEKLILEWEADVDSEHFDRDDNAGDDNEEIGAGDDNADPAEIYNTL